MIFGFIELMSGLVCGVKACAKARCEAGWKRPFIGCFRDVALLVRGWYLCMSLVRSGVKFVDGFGSGAGGGAIRIFLES
jgi:hypothetical protein